jgi:hypothetical protein
MMIIKSKAVRGKKLGNISLLPLLPIFLTLFTVGVAARNKLKSKRFKSKQFRGHCGKGKAGRTGKGA